MSHGSWRIDTALNEYNHGLTTEERLQSTVRFSEVAVVFIAVTEQFVCCGNKRRLKIYFIFALEDWELVGDI